MEFATPHELLSYLVDVEDDPERSDALHLGVSFRELAQREGKIAIDSSQERDRFARLLFMLKDDGGVNFSVQPGYEPDGTALGVTSQHADMVLDIRTTSEGRLAVQAGAIHALLRSLSTSITTHLDAIDAPQRERRLGKAPLFVSAIPMCRSRRRG